MAPERHSSLGIILHSTVVGGAAVVLALAATGSTYALFSDQATSAGATISTGNVQLTVNGDTDHTISQLSLARMLPGRSVVTRDSLTMSNTGTTPLNVTLAETTFTDPAAPLAPHITAALRPGTACTVAPDGQPPVTMTAPTLLVPGQSVSLCLEVALSASAPVSVQGSSATFTVNLSATQASTS
ncbi:MAG: SipW-cognate class signal peptide [Homoserinimonas sp.]|nr:SipW-cognate class signal peptide [Homoserinimonas sp.]